MRLRVKPLKRKNAGSGLAAIDRETMAELGVSSGEFVALEGPDGRVVARVWPGHSEDTGRGIVRIDGQLRQAAGVRIDDAVRVEAADVEPAERVTLALPENVRIQATSALTSRTNSPNGPSAPATRSPCRWGLASSRRAPGGGCRSPSSTRNPAAPSSSAARPTSR